MPKLVKLFSIRPCFHQDAEACYNHPDESADVPIGKRFIMGCWQILFPNGNSN